MKGVTSFTPKPRFPSEKEHPISSGQVAGQAPEASLTSVANRKTKPH
jgi:hypothetical protein